MYAKLTIIFIRSVCVVLFVYDRRIVHSPDPFFAYDVDRFIPHANRPNEASFAVQQPQESALVNQVESTTSSPYSEHIGYYNNPSYVTQYPVYFTTITPLEMPRPESAGPYTYYYLSEKAWRVPLFFAFAFVAYYGYLLIRHSVFTKVAFARKYDRDTDLLVVSRLVLSAIRDTY